MRTAVAPKCSWCGDPANEQVLVGWSNAGRSPMPRFTWMCDRDATDYKNERNHIRGQ